MLGFVIVLQELHNTYMADYESLAMNTGPLEQPPEGFPFTADSALRRWTEPAAFFLVPNVATRAIMYDPIAAGVTEHSNFLIHPWGRYLDTSHSAFVLTLEDWESALARGKFIFNKLHRHIHGVYHGVAYDANDPKLQMWVLDSGFHGIEEASRRWGQPLDDDQRSAIWQDTYNFGLFFGLPSRSMPKTLQELEEYRYGMLTGPELLRTDVSRDLVSKIFTYSSWKAPLPIARFGQAITKMSLDEELQQRLGEVTDVGVTPFDIRASALFDWTMQHTYSRLPMEQRAKVIPIALEGRHKLQQGIGHVATAVNYVKQMAA